MTDTKAVRQTGNVLLLQCFIVGSTDHGDERQVGLLLAFDTIFVLHEGVQKVQIFQKNGVPKKSRCRRIELYYPKT